MGATSRLMRLGARVEVCDVGPEKYPDGMPIEVGVQPMVGDCDLDRGDSDGELVQCHLNVAGAPSLGVQYVSRRPRRS